MDKRIINISFNKSGSGSQSVRAILPISIIRKMGFTEKDRKAELIFDEKKNELILKKV